MLTLNLASLSEAELKNIVADHCSSFGCPTTVKVLPPEERREYGIALVEMSSSGEANNLARKFGDSQYGSRLVVIKLYHGEKLTPKDLDPGESSGVFKLAHRQQAHQAAPIRREAEVRQLTPRAKAKPQVPAKVAAASTAPAHARTGTDGDWKEF